MKNKKKFTKFELFKFNSTKIKVGEIFSFPLRSKDCKEPFEVFIQEYFKSGLYSSIDVTVCETRNSSQIVLVPVTNVDKQLYRPEMFEIDELKYWLVKGVGIYNFFKI